MSIAGQGVSYDKCYSSLARTGPRQGRVKWTWRPRVTRGSREHDLRAAHTATRRGPKRTYALSRGEQLTVKRPSFTTLRTPPLPFSAHPRTADFSGSTARVRISPDCRSVVHAPSAERPRLAPSVPAFKPERMLPSPPEQDLALCDIREMP